MNGRVWAGVLVGLVGCDDSEVAPRDLSAQPFHVDAGRPPQKRLVPLPAPKPEAPPVPPPAPLPPLDAAPGPCAGAWTAALAQVTAGEQVGLGGVIAVRDGRALLVVARPLADAMKAHLGEVRSQFSSGQAAGAALLFDGELGLFAVPAPAGALAPLKYQSERGTKLKASTVVSMVWPAQPVQCTQARFVRQVWGTEGYVGPMLFDAAHKPQGVQPAVDPATGTLLGFVSDSWARSAVGQVMAMRGAGDQVPVDDLRALGEVEKPTSGLLDLTLTRRGDRCTLEVDWSLINLKGSVSEVMLAVGPGAGPHALRGPPPATPQPIGAWAEKAKAQPRLQLSAAAPCDGAFQLGLATEGQVLLSAPQWLPQAPVRALPSQELFPEGLAMQRVNEPERPPVLCPQPAEPRLDPTRLYLVERKPGYHEEVTLRPVDPPGPVIPFVLGYGAQPAAVLPDGRLAYRGAAVLGIFYESASMWVARPSRLLQEGRQCVPERIPGSRRDEHLWAPAAPGPARFIQGVMLTPDGVVSWVRSPGPGSEPVYALGGVPYPTGGGRLERVGPKGLKLIAVKGTLSVLSAAGELAPVLPALAPLRSASAALADGFLVAVLAAEHGTWTLYHVDPSGKATSKGTLPMPSVLPTSLALKEDGQLFFTTKDSVWASKVGAAEPRRLASAAPESALVGNLFVTP